MCLVILGTILFILFESNKCKKLDGYRFPVYSTPFCPRNESEWNKRSSALNCNKTNGYTCLPNEKLTELLEFCYRQPSILIEEGICLYLERKDSYLYSYSCHNFTDGCHNTSYQSIRIFEYPACISIGNGCFLAEISCKSSPNTTNQPEATDNENDDLFWVVILMGVIVLVFFFFLCMLNFYRKKEDRANELKEKELLIGDNENTKDSPNIENPKIPHLLKDISVWREDDKLYLETHNFPAMFEKVKSQPYVMFVGVSGSGKTATARHIALKLQEEGYEILSIKKMKFIEKYCVQEKKQVFVIDDVLGIFGFNMDLLKLLQRYNETLINLSKSNTKVIMTCREEVYRNEKFSTNADKFLQREEHVVLLHSAENTLNDQDKIGLLKKYNIDVNTLSQADFAKTSDMFPYLCKLYKEFSNYGPTFFRSPVPIILEKLSEMETHHPVQYASLVLVMANQNKMSIQDLKNIGKNSFEDKNYQFLESCKVSPILPGYKFQNALTRMVQTYTQECNGEFTFVHDSMFEIVAYHFGHRNPELMLKYMSSNFIANNITLNTSGTTKKEMLIKLDKQEHYRLLAERLYKDVKHGEFYNVFGNEDLKRQEVLDCFMEEMKKTSYEEIVTVFISKLNAYQTMRNIDHNQREHDTRHGYTHSKRWRSSKHVLTQDRHGMVCMRAISWVVFYGHHQILQCIIDKMRAQEESIDNLFLNESELRNYNKALNEEKNRLLICLLVSACYYGDMRLVKAMIEAKVDVNLIYKEDDTPLIAACRGGHINVVTELIEAGAEVNQAKYNCYWSCPDGMDPDEWKEVSRELNERTIGFQRHECETPIVVACGNENIELIQLLINKGADVNISKHLAGTPLIQACKMNHIGVVELLLQNGANVSLIDFDGKTPLRNARTKKHFTIIKQLIDKGFENGDKTLSSACYEGDLNAVKRFINAGSEVNLKDNVIAPIKAACLAGHVDVVKELISKGADVNLWDGDQLPLTTACDKGLLRVVKELIKEGVKLNLKYQDETALTIACYRNHTEIVKELIEARVDVNQAGHYGTPLSIASLNENLEIARALLKAGADHNVEDHNETPLSEAIFCENVDLFNMMIESRDVVNFAPALRAACLVKNSMMVNQLLKTGTNTDLGAALVHACHKTQFYSRLHFKLRYLKERPEQQLSIVRMLIEAGADVNYVAKYYGTPLENASENGYLSVVKELLKKNAVVDKVGRYQTPLIAACSGGHLNVVKELVKAGADVNLETQKNKRTPLAAACFKNNLDVVKELINEKADVNCIDRDSIVFLDICGYQDILNELKEAGVDISRVNTTKQANVFE